MDYPQARTLQFLPKSLHPSKLPFLGFELSIYPDSTTEHLQGDYRGTRYNLAIDRGGILYGFKKVKPLNQADLIALSHNGKVRVFLRGEITPEQIDEELSPPPTLQAIPMFKRNDGTRHFIIEKISQPKIGV